MDATDAFDVTREPEHIRKMYGEGTQARELLIARRLVERGVRFVQVWHGGGQPRDNHDDLEVNVAFVGQEGDALGVLDEAVAGGEGARLDVVALVVEGRGAGLDGDDGGAGVGVIRRYIEECLFVAVFFCVVFDEEGRCSRRGVCLVVALDC